MNTNLRQKKRLENIYHFLTVASNLDTFEYQFENLAFLYTFLVFLSFKHNVWIDNGNKHNNPRDDEK